MAYSPAVVNALRKYAPSSGAPVAYVAAAMVESNLDPYAIGDNGDSVGLFQENENGRGYGLSVAERQNPVENARRAAEEFARTRGSGPVRAFNAQRPEDRADYIAKVRAKMDEARQLLGQRGPQRSVTAGDSATEAPDLDLSSLAIGALGNRRQGESFTRSVANQFLARQLTAPDAVADKTPAQQAALSTVGTPSKPTSKAEQALEFGREVIGTPYSWGGGGPGGAGRGFAQGANTVGFDCSSLMQYVTSKVGISIPRTTYGQIKVGKGVNARNQAAWSPGDLLFPSTGHVQMYVGNGQVLEAPRTGGHVQIVPARSSYIAVRRVM